MLMISRGKIVWANNASGHYRPDEELLDVIRNAFHQLLAHVLDKRFVVKSYKQM